MVTTTADSGSGSLRQAIVAANLHAGLDTIRFAIPGSGVHTIGVQSALPTIVDAVSIDGYTQPGASASSGTLLIELSGAGTAVECVRVEY